MGRPWGQEAEDGSEVLLAHELLHLDNLDEGFLEDVGVPSVPRGLDHRLLVCVAAAGAGVRQLETLPHFPMVDSGVLGIGLNLAGPLGEIIQLAGDFLDLLIREERWRGKLKPGKLELLLGLHQNALPIFEVDDVEQLVRHDETVPGAKALRDPAGEIQPLFDEDQRIGALQLGLGELLQHELHTAVCVCVHFVTVVLGHRLAGAYLQSAAELVFAEGVGGGSAGAGAGGVAGAAAAASSGSLWPRAVATAWRLSARERMSSITSKSSLILLTGRTSLRHLGDAHRFHAVARDQDHHLFPAAQQTGEQLFPQGYIPALHDAAALGFLGHADLQIVSHDLFLSERQVSFAPFTGRPREHRIRTVCHKSFFNFFRARVVAWRTADSSRPSARAMSV